MNAFGEMTVNELYDLVLAANAAHHSFNQQGALYGNLDDGWQRLQRWCDGYCDQFAQQVVEACEELQSRTLSRPMDLELRTLALAVAAPLLMVQDEDKAS